LMPTIGAAVVSASLSTGCVAETYCDGKDEVELSATWERYRGLVPEGAKVCEDANDTTVSSSGARRIVFVHPADDDGPVVLINATEALGFTRTDQSAPSARRMTLSFEKREDLDDGRVEGSYLEVETRRRGNWRQRESPWETRLVLRQECLRGRSRDNGACKRD